MLPQRVPGERARRPAVGGAGGLGRQGETEGQGVLSRSGLRDGRSTVAAFKSSAEKVGASSTGEVFAPLDSKDYTQYFGQLRASRPEVLYTSVAGNDTVRLFSQLQEFGLLNNMTVVGASGTVTAQNIQAIGKAAKASSLVLAIRPKSIRRKTRRS